MAVLNAHLLLIPGLVPPILKFLHRFPQDRIRNFKSKGGTRI
jgi:hypothetical protein